MSAFSVAGSHGYMSVDCATGSVLMYDPDGTESNEYSDILCIDVQELMDTYQYTPVTLEGKHFDILDVGFWYGDGEYETPEADWRGMGTAMVGGQEASDCGY